MVRVNSKRENVGLISTVTNQGKVKLDGAKRRVGFRSAHHILKRLVKDAKLVKAWLAKQQDEIEVFYLPSYSPELNPDEMLNADLKQAVTTKAPARTKGATTQDDYQSYAQATEITRAYKKLL